MHYIKIEGSKVALKKIHYTAKVQKVKHNTVRDHCTTIPLLLCLLEDCLS